MKRKTTEAVPVISNRQVAERIVDYLFAWFKKTMANVDREKSIKLATSLYNKLEDPRYADDDPVVERALQAFVRDPRNLSDLDPDSDKQIESQLAILVSRFLDQVKEAEYHEGLKRMKQHVLALKERLYAFRNKEKK